MFGKKKKQQTVATNTVPNYTQKVLWAKQFPQASSFRGFRQIKMTSGYPEMVEATLSKYRPDYNFKGCIITLQYVETKYRGQEPFREIYAYVSGNYIGRIAHHFDEGIDWLTNYNYDKAYIKVEEYNYADGKIMGQNVYLFLHFVGQQPIKVRTRVVSE